MATIRATILKDLESKESEKLRRSSCAIIHVFVGVLRAIHITLLGLTTLLTLVPLLLTLLSLLARVALHVFFRHVFHVLAFTLTRHTIPVLRILTLSSLSCEFEALST